MQQQLDVKWFALQLAVERWKEFDVVDQRIVDTAQQFVLYLNSQDKTEPDQNPVKGRTTRKSES